MVVPVEFFCDKSLLPPYVDFGRLKAIASRPGLVGRVAALPDFHFTVKNYIPAGVVLVSEGFLYPELSSPPNDGICAVQTSIFAEELSEKVLNNILMNIRDRIGLFRRKDPIIDETFLRRIIGDSDGLEPIAKDWGYEKSDLKRVEYNGRFPWAADLCEDSLDRLFPPEDERPPMLPDFVPDHNPIEAGKRALGVIDGGSHFWELVVVDRIIDGEKADLLNLKEGQVIMTLHAGAGDLGLIAHRKFFPQDPGKSTGISVDSEPGRQFQQATAVATRFAWANRLYIMAEGRKAISQILCKDVDIKMIGDVSHDLVEPNRFGSYSEILYRKGAARAIPARFFEADPALRVTGLPFYFPSSIGGRGYIVSNSGGNPDTFFTCSHGTGRLINKDQALELFGDQDISTQMSFPDVHILRYGFSQFPGQAPHSFRDMKPVLEALGKFNLARPIVSLRPIAVLKP